MGFINQLIKNKGQTDKPCESILGDETNVHTLANMWEYADLIHIIGINEFIEWTSENKFTERELEAFQAGLSAFPNFAEKCYKEMKDNELSSGSKSAG